jgi:hypothetical protein
MMLDCRTLLVSGTVWKAMSFRVWEARQIKGFAPGLASGSGPLDAQTPA